jgi:hypothetical protein
VTVQTAAGPPSAVGLPINPGAPADTGLAKALLAEGGTYTAGQQAAQASLVASILAVWATINVKNAIPSWKSGIGTKIYVLLSMLQELAARDANSYVLRTLALQGLRSTGPDINPLNFAGIASDGRDLESLLAGAVVALRQSEEQGHGPAVGLRRGEDWLRLVANTQVADAARAAESVTISISSPVDPNGKGVELGWVRVLNPPSCGRCVALAGKFFRWNQGFFRHPNCDCRHMAVTQANASPILTDPMIYFNSLTEQEQNRYFGTGQAEAIRNGAAIDRVINASRNSSSMYTADDGKRYTRELARKDGYYGIRKDQIRRPTPGQIYKDSKDDKAKAIALLRQFGYITGPAAQ